MNSLDYINNILVIMLIIFNIYPECFRYGRKYVLWLSGPVTLASFVIVIFTKNIIGLYVVRILQGTTFALVFSVGPLYIAEIARPKTRGLLTGQFQAMWALGELFTYLVGPHLDLHSYLLVCCILPVVFTVVFYFVPETPYYLIMKKRNEEAARSLQWVRGTKDVNEELESIKKSVERDLANNASWLDLFATAKDIRILATVQILCFMKYAMGSPALTSYAASIFAHASNGSLNMHSAAVIYGTLLVVAAAMGSFLSDSVGRKRVLLGTCLSLAICYSVAAIYFYVDDNKISDLGGYSWILYLSISMSALLSNAGPNSLLQTIQGELFPSHTRALGGGLTCINSAVVSFLDLKQYQTFVDAFGMYSNFVCYAFFSLCCAILMWIILKETAEKSLGEIQLNMVQKDEKQSKELVSESKIIV